MSNLTYARRFCLLYPADTAAVMLYPGPGSRQAVRSRFTGCLHTRLSWPRRPQSVESFDDRTDHVDWHRKDDRVALVTGDRRQRLQEPQLHRLRLLGQHARGLQQLFRRLLLAFGVNHLRASCALGFRLLSDRAHHRFIDVDVFDLDIRRP